MAHYTLTKQDYQIAHVASAERTRYAVDGILLEPGPTPDKGLAVATNAKALAARVVPRTGEPETVIIPTNVELEDHCESEVSSDEQRQRVTFTGGEKTITVPAIDPPFPAWWDVVPKAPPDITFGIDAGMLMSLAKALGDTGRVQIGLYISPPDHSGGGSQVQKPFVVTSLEVPDAPRLGVLMPVAPRENTRDGTWWTRLRAAVCDRNL